MSCNSINSYPEKPLYKPREGVKLLSKISTDMDALANVFKVAISAITIASYSLGMAVASIAKLALVSFTNVADIGTIPKLFYDLLWRRDRMSGLEKVSAVGAIASRSFNMLAFLETISLYRFSLAFGHFLSGIPVFHMVVSVIGIVSTTLDIAVNGEKLKKAPEKLRKDHFVRIHSLVVGELFRRKISEQKGGETEAKIERETRNYSELRSKHIIQIKEILKESSEQELKNIYSHFLKQCNALINDQSTQNGWENVKNHITVISQVSQDPSENRSSSALYDFAALHLRQKAQKADNDISFYNKDRFLYALQIISATANLIADIVAPILLVIGLVTTAGTTLMPIVLAFAFIGAVISLLKTGYSKWIEDERMKESELNIPEVYRENINMIDTFADSIFNQARRGAIALNSQ